MRYKQKVFSNLDDALANGYDVRDWTPDEIVCDLQAYAADCESVSADQLRPHVVAWLASHLKPCPFCKSQSVDAEGWASTDRKGPACDDCGGTADTMQRWNTRPLESACD